MRVAKLHENDRDKAELKPLGGEESSAAELENKVTDEMELSLANMSANDRVRMAELELPGGEGGSQAEPGDVSEHDGDRVSLEVQSDAAELELQGGYESGTAELQDDQFPPIQDTGI